MSLKKKQADSISEMSEQMDQLNKMKVKVAKDCAQIANEINDVRAATDEVGRSKVSAVMLVCRFPIFKMRILCVAGFR